MGARISFKDRLKKFIKLVTFVDLPINNKFILFSIGVVFWFILMFIVSTLTNIEINSKTSRIVNQVMPYEKVSQKIIRKLQSLNVDIAEIEAASDLKILHKKTELSKMKIADIKSFVSALSYGGEIYDIDRNTGKFFESITVTHMNGEIDKKYLDDLSPLIDKLDIKIQEIEGLKLNVLNRTSKDESLLAKKISEYKEMLSASVILSTDFSIQTVNLYAVNTEKIRNVTMVNSYISAIVLIMATGLLAIFTFSISRVFVGPIKSIINQIRALSEGRTDLSQKIRVRSKDEIGILTRDFNNLLDEIQDMTTFKKIIEEDESLEDVYSRLGKVFHDRFELDEFIIYEINNSQNRMKPVYPLMIGEKEIFCNMDILTNCNLCKVKKTGRVISSSEYPDICRQFRSDIDKIHVCIPMTIGGTTGGVAQFLFDRKYFAANGAEIRIFKYEQYIKESLSVIEAKRLMGTLRESALKDALTGLYNRRFLQEYTETLISGVLRRKKIIGLIMCDLDYFKQVNDVYGHNIGDKILKETADILKNCVRSSDLVIRFGGEEFLALLIDINDGESVNIAEKIRRAVEEKKITVPDGTIKKTISLGVSEFPIDTESFWQAIKFSDVALYRAKETGRNKFVRFTKEMWTEEEF